MKLSLRSIVVLLVVSGGVIGLGVYFTRSQPEVSRDTAGIRPKPYGYRLSFTRKKAHRGNPPIETSARGHAKLITHHDTIVVTVRLTDLKTKASYPLHLHEGSCRKGGAGGLQLEPVQSNERGKGKSRTVVHLDELNPTMDHLIMVHNPSNRHILCSDLPAFSRLRQ